MERYQKAGIQLLVGKEDLAQLATEITQLKQNIPLVLNTSASVMQTKIHILEVENEKLREQCRHLLAEKDHWKSRHETAIADTQTEKQECIKLRCELQSLGQQLSQQLEYCTSLGSACCTLLWRVSRQEDTIQAILAGTKVDEFLSLVSSTLASYVSAYREDWPRDDTEETHFILALCGIITNIAASAYGREFLCTNPTGKEILDTYIKALSDAPQGKSARLKNLLVMCLYNASINQKGSKFLEAKPGLLSLCAWLIQGESDCELRLNSLRLIQSLVCDQTNLNTLHKLQEALPSVVLDQLSRDSNSDMRNLALELLSDISQITHNT
ncbi:heat shock factor 2-binding protein-like [Mya arenaria]|uniref:heat shock factor 2-binding protein-like n=1 Tax=Mya arenaria TaxID=6604 RepID=UPI0022E36033|nr:heat shock factor 2-binding protein-like [Mya arenaria]